MNVLSKLSDLLMMTEKQVFSFASTAPHRYKVYTIPKRNSSERRIIAHPSKELKFVQRVLLKELRSVLEPSDRAYAYVPGRNIKENALQHAGSKYLLKMDFKNFFPSIVPSVFFDRLQKRGVCFSEVDEKVLSGLLFWKPVRKGGLVLSIGAPSSPLVSNFVMRDFDEHINHVSVSLGVDYTRYADDLTFSTMYKDTLFSFPELVERSLDVNGYKCIKINKKKTIFSSMAHNRHVTGVTLTNDGGVSVGRERKRKISAMIHRFKLGQMSYEDASKLRGLLAFVEHIEPGFVEKMKNKYGAEAIDLLFGSSGVSE